MREDFLHYLWKYKKFAFAKAHTTTNQSISLRSVEQHNHEAGPDFFNARLSLDEQEWAGNVEIHLKSSDWYAHGHETDEAYTNVILHVVWEHDVDIYREDNTALPTLELKDYVSKEQLANYQQLFAHQNKRWIHCENDLSQVPSHIWDHWQERLYLERLQHKTGRINTLLLESNNDWEHVLFIMLARNFGTKVNGESFESLARALDFNVVRKCAQEPFRLEALLLGAGDLLPDDSVDSYALQLEGEYEFIQHKFQLVLDRVLPIQFFKLRPVNFPTIRLSQLAQLYNKVPGLFQRLIKASTLDEMYDILTVQASAYWDTHFNFGKSQNKRAKKLTKSFIDLLLINTVIPLKFAYNEHLGKDEQEDILELISQIKPEKNTVVQKYDELKPKATSAMQTQALVQLKNEYCSKHQCLQCAVGNWLIGK
jgi:hypothetical protein